MFYHERVELRTLRAGPISRHLRQMAERVRHAAGRFRGHEFHRNAWLREL